MHRHPAGFGGENALARYDETAYNSILQQCAAAPRVPHGFTYLRLDDTLMQQQNLNTFAAFTAKMAQLGGANASGHVLRGARAASAAVALE